MNAEFNREYDISKHFYVDGADKKIPSKIEIKVSDAVPENNCFNFEVQIRSLYHYGYNTYKSFKSGYHTDDEYIMIIDVSKDGTDWDELNAAKLNLVPYGLDNTNNNIIFEYIKFIY